MDNTKPTNPIPSGNPVNDNSADQNPNAKPADPVNPNTSSGGDGDGDNKSKGTPPASGDKPAPSR